MLAAVMFRAQRGCAMYIVLMQLCVRGAAIQISPLY